MNLSDHHIELHLSDYIGNISTKVQNDRTYILDPIRKKYLVLQPEELVRQTCILWMIDQGFSRNRLQVEKLIKINGLSRRFDIVVYDKEVRPYILVECKAPDVRIDQSTFDQIASYQMALNAPYLMVSNGISNYLAQMNHEVKQYRFFNEIPSWEK
ncbi:MAG TPA: type I restriction enzyme HsdR N-terminal domain-containing protein [Saprospiraceae bacterium]|nr:type I restriction enzyme HsdR N-terminal domain-containing protein [Saprospiraceae bacterium]